MRDASASRSTGGAPPNTSRARPPAKSRPVDGSHSSVTSRAPWILDTEAALAAFVEAGVPTFGICFGHQLLAQALGGVVTKNPRGREIGTVEFELVEPDPLFAAAPERFAVNMSHVDSAERLPDGARRLGRTRLDPNGAVRFGERAWGVQFHPEFDADVIRAYLAARREILREEGIAPEPLESAVRDSAHGGALLRRFAALLDA